MTEIERFRVGVGGYVAGLVLQFWLGTWVNLFVDVPKRHPGANPPEYFSGVARSVTWAILQGPSLWLTAHAILGLVLVLGAFGLLARVISSPSLRFRGLVTALVFGVVGVLGAGFNGGSFLNYHEDFSSMLMASGFAVAMLSYLAAMTIALPRPASTAPTGSEDPAQVSLRR